MSIYDRHSYITRDSLGNDPLTDKLAEVLRVVPYSTMYTVPAHNEFRSDKISTRLFGTPDLYWAILTYNNLVSNMELLTGTVLKVPDINILNSTLIQLSQGKRLSKQIYLK